MDAAFFAGFNQDLHSPSRWEAFYQSQRAAHPHRNLPAQTPALPRLDGEWLFNDMMKNARAPDPWMFPALQALQQSQRFLVAALSNTVIFPPGHPLYQPDAQLQMDPLRVMFDVFVSSAHVGLRKPDPQIYRLALDKVNRFARAHADTERGRALGWSKTDDVIKPGDVVFLDDIGENLKAAKAVGFRTIKVPLGKAFEAVEQLEEVTGLELAGAYPKIPIRPDFQGSAGPKAKI